MPRAPLRTVFVFALLAALARPAHATSAAEDAAKALFVEGLALLHTQPLEAIDKLERSHARFPTVAALLNLGDANERLGRFAAAHARFVEAEQLAGTTYPEGAAEARRRADALATRLATEVVEPPRPALATTRPALATTPNDVPRREEVRAPAWPATRSVALVGGGLGVSSLLATTVSGVLALGSAAALRETCPAYPLCPQREQSRATDLDVRTRTLGTVATTTAIAGGVLLVASAVLWVAFPRQRPLVQNARFEMRF